MKYVFTNGKILNGTKDMQVQEGQVILVENERITELLPAEEAGKRNLKASGYEEIDLQGMSIWQATESPRRNSVTMKHWSKRS